jgi:hypothetical protein
MAQGVGYTIGASRSSVEELAEAGWLEQRHGQPAHYRAHWSRWRVLVGIDEQETPRWEPWHQRFMLVTAFGLFCEHLEREMALSPPAPYAVGIEMRALLEMHRAALGELDVASWGAHQQVKDWTDLGVQVMRRMAQFLNAGSVGTGIQLPAG